MTPFKRYAHTATLIDNKLYILGGRVTTTTNNENIGKQFFYLDVSVLFNVKNIIWHNLTDINTVPAHRAAASVSGGPSKDILFLYIGNYDGVEMELFYAFDTKSNTWSVPKIANGENVKRTHNLKGIVDDKGKMYLFGGKYKDTNEVLSNDMLILDTINLNLKLGSKVDAPTQRCLYGVTFVPSNFIIYFGGSYDQKNSALPLKEVYQYDTINDNWSTKAGKIPTDRNSFSTVLGLNGQRVIIFGGSAGDNDIELQEALYILNLANFEWSLPKTSGTYPAQTRGWHEANVIGKYMVISFGIGKDTDGKDLNEDILLLDISNDEEYVWTYDFDITESSTNPSEQKKSPSINPAKIPLIPKEPQNTSTKSAQSTGVLSIPAIIGIVITSIICGILLSFGGFFIYKWKWNKSGREVERAIPTPGNEKGDDSNEVKVPTRNINKISSYGSKLFYRWNKNKLKYKRAIPTPGNEDDNSNHKVITISKPKLENNSIVTSSTDNQRVLQQIDLENFKNDIIQVVRQEIKQNLQQNI
ncbi:10556_t:CDS:2 [Funneliformis caledonium]|uniref:10556_t:CDS:1 n=1 Tax=Funneliformis caledonium TaxID=1117310 RepID=A0A9N9DLI0_9GLOM|nr:10556_t:CDS:2 [Funneliformis caledonium]